MFYAMATPFYISASSVRGRHFFCILTNTCYFPFVLFIAVLVCVRGSHCVFISISLLTKKVKYLHVLIGDLYIFFGEMPVQALCQFINYLLIGLFACIIELYAYIAYILYIYIYVYIYIICVWERERQRLEDATTLKMEEETMSQRMQEASRNWKRQWNRFSPRACGRKTAQRTSLF